MYSRQLESFIETAKAGSFSKAARSLYIAPSSLIQQIDLLEQRLGLTLFNRGPRGVTLTKAGESLFQDSVEIVHQCEKAIMHARMFEGGDGPIRVATSLLMKCRMLPSIWSRMIENEPDTRIDIFSLESAGIEPGDYLGGLGISYDVMEGLYMSELYQGRCNFLELERVPLCVAIPRTVRDAIPAVVDEELLHNLDLVMMKPGVSKDYDDVRTYLTKAGANKITDVSFYTMELFADCELNKRAIVTAQIWEDIHPELVCIPLQEPHTIPYGLIFPKDPSPQGMRLYKATKRVK